MYYAKVNWYNSFTEEDEISHMFICASDWNDAMQAISYQFDYINSIDMKEIEHDKTTVLYVPEEAVEKIIEENLC